MKKTLLINCSPKQKLSVSGFAAKFTGIMLRGEKVYMHLRTPADYQPILEELKTADRVVFAVPLFVDSVPSHMLPFMKKMEAFCRENRLRQKVYVISNNGFIEGKQNEPLMRVMENFCSRSGLCWRGGVGFGGGVMVNVTRVMLPIEFGITLLNMLLNGLRGRNAFEPLSSFAPSALFSILLCGGIIACLARLAFHISGGTDAGKRYTRILLPSFLFIPITDIFFTVVSALRGGIFRGWFRKHLPDEKCGIMFTKAR